MQDYHIYAHYQKEQTSPPTSPQYEMKESETVAVRSSERERSNSQFNITPRKTVGGAIVIAGKINNYVGEYTENTIAARKNQIGLTVAAIGLVFASNPIAGGIAAAYYVSDNSIKYGIKQYKENLEASYLKKLSNGTVKAGR